MTYLEKVLKDKELSNKILNVFARLASHVDGSCRNVDNRILEVVNENYKYEDYINAYGEIYVIEKFLGFDGEDRLYLCKRLKFDMKTSKERYQIREVNEFDSDDQYDYTDYEIKLFEEKE